MLLDKYLTFSEAQTCTGAENAVVVSSNVIDLRAGGDDINRYLNLNSVVTTAFAGSGMSVTAKLYTDADEAFGSPTLIHTGPTVALASCDAVGDKLLDNVVLPFNLERYLRVTYTITGAAATGGAVSTFLTPSMDVGL